MARKYGEYSTDAPSGVQRVAQPAGQVCGRGRRGGAGRLPYFDADPRLIHISGQLAFAIEQRRTVHLHYRSENGEFREDVCPVRLLSRYNADYVAAYQEHEGKTRLYRLDAIESLHVTNRMFEINEAGDVPFVKGRPPAIQPLRPGLGWIGSFRGRPGMVIRQDPPGTAFTTSTFMTTTRSCSSLCWADG
ncbi:WYL domain-containing protein [Paenibacillus sp. JTLBN-2024]